MRESPPYQTSKSFLDFSNKGKVFFFFFPLFFLLFLLTETHSLGAQLFKISRLRKQILVRLSSQEYPILSPQLKKSYCIQEFGRSANCGYVLQLRSNFLLLQLATPANPYWKAGQNIHLVPGSHSRSLASVSREEKEVMKTYQEIFDVGFSFYAGLDYFLPSFFIQLAFLQKFSFGIEPIYTQIKNDNTVINTLGGFLNLSYYHTHFPFRGFLATLGFGYYQFHLSSRVGSASLNNFGIKLGGQYRGKLQILWNIEVGLELGTQYIFQKTVPSNVKTNFEGLLPYIRVIVAHTF